MFTKNFTSIQENTAKSNFLGEKYLVIMLAIHLGAPWYILVKNLMEKEKKINVMKIINKQKLTST